MTVTNFVLFSFQSCLSSKCGILFCLGVRVGLDGLDGLVFLLPDLNLDYGG